MRALQIKSHERLDLLKLQNFPSLRVSPYRGLSLERTIDRFLDRLDTKWEFESAFSLAVFMTDEGEALRQRLDHLWWTTYLT